MKEYKIDLSMYEGKVREVVSEAVQKKAFELGYEWLSAKSVVNTDRPWLVFNFDGTIAWNHSNSQTIKDYPLITAEAFLSLSSAKDEPVFKPFDKVLVRNNNNEEWMPAIYWKPYGKWHKTTPQNTWNQCNPYEGNEHLLGTTDNA